MVRKDIAPTITNDNGTKVIELASGKGFKVKSTMFPQNNIHISILIHLYVDVT